MVGKIFLVLCTLALLRPVYPSPLTKEINAEQSPELKFRFILAELERTNILGELITLALGNFEDIYLNVTNLLESQGIPDISTVLDTFNFGFGARLLYINENNIQVDPNGVEELFTDKVRSMVRSVFPGNYVQQIVVYRTLQKQIQKTVDKLRPEIENRKISLDDIGARAAADQETIQPRDWMSALQISVCNTLVESAYSQLNETLNNATDILDSITIWSNDNAVLSILANLVTNGIDIIERIISYVWEFAESIQSSICTTLLSSRKRRDLTVVQEIAERSKRDISWAGADTEIITARSITVIVSVVWSVVATILGYALASLVNRLIMSIVTYLLGTVTQWLYSIIDSIF